MPKLGFLRRFSGTSKSSAEKVDGAHATGMSVVVPTTSTLSKHLENTEEQAASSLDVGQCGACTDTPTHKMLWCSDTIRRPVLCTNEYSHGDGSTWTKYLYSDEDPPDTPKNSNEPPKTEAKTQATECKIVEKTEEIEV
jgi:hypothetical protein